MIIRWEAALFSVGLATLALWAPPAQADAWNKKTTFTFNQPVEVPGHVLTAGQYVFELADLQADRNVVQIFSQDKQGMDHLVTTTFAIPDYELRTPEKPSITFEERRSDSPEAVHSWWYPGDNYGWEFVYPKSESLVSTAATTTPPAQPAPPAPAPKTAVSTPSAKPAPAPAPAQQPVTVAQNHPPAQPPSQPQAQPAPAPAPAPKTLPQTASDLPLLEVLGGLMTMLGAGLLLGRRRVRV